jgi:hypothetical protein
LTLEQGSMDSSLAATRATHPWVTVLRYTSGVFPISCTSETEYARINHLPSNPARRESVEDAGAHLGDVVGDRRR